jgi:hypothetical protein
LDLGWQRPVGFLRFPVEGIRQVPVGFVEKGAAVGPIRNFSGPGGKMKPMQGLLGKKGEKLCEFFSHLSD